MADQIDSELEREAAVMEPILSHCYALYRDGCISPSDLVGIFIISYLGLRRKKSWSNGRLKCLMSSYLNCRVSAPPSVELSSVPGLLDILDRGYVAKRMDRGGDKIADSERFLGVTVLSIFDGLQLCGIKKNADDYVNRCLVGWAYDLRPCCLMLRIPSPLEVLKQQAEGRRVITMFHTRIELGRRHIAMLYYMEGMQNHSKDCLEFLLHDMKHMENFIDSATHLEQVGFFRCMLKPYVESTRLNFSRRASDDLCGIKNKNSADTVITDHPLSPCSEIECRSMTMKKFLLSVCGYDKQLWRELEYAISDMNCYCTHLMQYVLAKMLFATERLLMSEHPVPDPVSEIISVPASVPIYVPDSVHISISVAGPTVDAPYTSPGTLLPSTDKHFLNRTENPSNSVILESDPGSCVSKSEKSSLLKDLLMERWIVFLGILGMGEIDIAGIEPTGGDDDGHEEETDRLRRPILAAAAHSAAVGMVLTAFKERGPLTADEGAALREYFRGEGSRVI